jgi:uncharacterized membrane protein YhaH (DUF805 family)
LGKARNFPTSIAAVQQRWLKDVRVLKGVASLFDLDGRLSRGGFYAVVLLTLPYFLWVMWMQFQVMPQQRFEPVFLLAPWGVIQVFALIRRMHDRDRGAGWMLFFFAVPLAIGAFGALLGEYLHAHDYSDETRITWLGAIGIIGSVPMTWAFYELYLARGTRGPNRFGSDPTQS